MLKTVSTLGGGGSTGAVTYKGTWNAATNSPTLTSSVGTQGDYYVVSVAGTTTLDGISLWSVGDWAVFNGSVWQKVVGSTNEAFNSVTVTGLTGYMYANNTSPVTASTTIPVAAVNGAVANSVYIIAGSGLSGGGPLTGNVTLTATGGSNGTVTNVATGTGLTGGPITTTGTISLANTTVVTGLYGSASQVPVIEVNSQGQLTSASNLAIAIGVANVSGAVANTVNVLAGGLLTGGGALTGNVTISLTSVPSGNVSGLGTMAVQNSNNVTITGGSINVQSTNLVSTTSSTATFATASLPLVPAGYIQVDLNGTVVKVPYYAV